MEERNFRIKTYSRTSTRWEDHGPKIDNFLSIIDLNNMINMSTVTDGDHVVTYFTMKEYGNEKTFIPVHSSD